MKNNGLFKSALLLALSRFALMPIISVILFVAGLFTDILATYIGIVMILGACLLFSTIREEA